jgi:hypothetical protein
VVKTPSELFCGAPAYQLALVVPCPPTSVIEEMMLTPPTQKYSRFFTVTRLIFREDLQRFQRFQYNQI